MKVLSLFDWIGCWFVALKRAWIEIEKYYASEIDKNAVMIAMKNNPSIIQLWDVRNIRGGGLNIDLLMWWSPCQWFSKAWRWLNFDDPRSKLFFEFVRLLKETKPKYFLLENVEMKKERMDVISEYLWVQPIKINSSLVSAQNRKRLYRTNIPWVKQPEDKKIMLKDILQVIQDQPWVKTNLAELVDGEMRIKQATKKWYIVAHEWDGIDVSYENSQTRRWRCIKWKSNTLTTQWNACVYDKVIRRLTPVECERLQTLPDNYTEWVSENQRYKMLWNWWTVDVIAHIFNWLK